MTERAAPKSLPESLAACSAVSPLLARLGDKWTILVVMLLAEGPRRFNDIKRSIGVSQRMLTLTLRAMERDGMATRTLYPTIPPRVDYALTDLGRSLIEPVKALGAWAVANAHTIQEAQKAFDGRKD